MTARRRNAANIVVRVAGLVVAALAVGACRSPAPRSPASQTEPAASTAGVTRVAPRGARCDCNTRLVQRLSESAALLDYYANLRTKTAAGQRQELDELRREFAAGSAEAVRIKLAMVYLLPGAAIRNEGQAAQLLDPYARGDSRADSPFRGIAQLLLAHLDQSRRLEAGTQAQAAKLREEQKRSEELQRKLDALKEVERAMILKDQGVKTK